MKLVLYCLCFIGSFCSALAPLTGKEESTISQQWANFVTRQTMTEESTRSRSKLRDDPELQREHDHVCYQNIVSQLQTMKKEVTSEPSEKKLEELALACHVLAMHFNANQDSQAAERIDDVIELAARIKLLQDPFWRMIVKNITERKKTFSLPSFSAEELDHDLCIQDSKKDTLIKILLQQYEEKELRPPTCSPEAFEQLSKALVSYKKSPEEIVALITGLELPISTRTKETEKKAKALYNGAAVSEITGNSKFLPLKSSSDFLNLEKAYTIAAFLYLQSYDLGHPNGLREAEKLISGSIMFTIVEWKEQNGFADAFKEYNEIRQEIYKRKYPHSSGGAASSSTE